LHQANDLDPETNCITNANTHYTNTESEPKSETLQFIFCSVPKMQTTTQQFSIRGFEVDISVRNANTQIPLRRKAILVTWPKLFNASTKSVILCIKSQQ
jgi:hypothetical protein